MQNAKIMGLDRDDYNSLASAHSKRDMFIWVLAGLVYNFTQGELVSLSSLLIVIPGVFIASFVGIPAFLINLKKMEIVPQTNNIFVLIGFSVWYLVDLVYPAVLSILYIQLVNIIL